MRQHGTDLIRQNVGLFSFLTSVPNEDRNASVPMVPQLAGFDSLRTDLFLGGFMPNTLRWIAVEAVSQKKNPIQALVKEGVGFDEALLRPTTLGSHIVTGILKFPTSKKKASGWGKSGSCWTSFPRLMSIRPAVAGSTVLDPLERFC